METDVKITVAKVDGHIRVIAMLPACLDVLSPNDQTRMIETAMWRAAEAIGVFIEQERMTGATRPIRAQVQAA